MQQYNLVIASDLKELIDTVNLAIKEGYTPIGSMLFVNEKFIQPIYKKK